MQSVNFRWLILSNFFMFILFNSFRRAFCGGEEMWSQSRYSRREPLNFLYRSREYLFVRAAEGETSKHVLST